MASYLAHTLSHSLCWHPIRWNYKCLMMTWEDKLFHLIWLFSLTARSFQQDEGVTRKWEKMFSRRRIIFLPDLFRARKPKAKCEIWHNKGAAFIWGEQKIQVHSDSPPVALQTWYIYHVTYVFRAGDHSRSQDEGTCGVSLCGAGLQSGWRATCVQMWTEGWPDEGDWWPAREVRKAQRTEYDWELSGQE